MGPNALGKTTVVEAIYFLMTGRSFRTHRLQDLFKEGTRRFDLACEYEKEGEIERVHVTVTPQKKEVAYTHSRSTNLSALLGNLVGSILTPDDVNLIKGSPQARREFLDLQILKTDPFYHWHLSRYVRAMRQRNQLLKTKRLSLCESWENEMAVSAAYITSARKEALLSLIPHFSEAYQKLQEANEAPSLEFLTQDKEGEGVPFYLSAWQRLRSKESLLGFTLVGPHKDDLSIAINEKDAKAFGSEGQKQTLLLALKLAEWQRLKTLQKENPLFLIDDVGISLDKSRREKLFQATTEMGQVFLTTTDKHNFPLDPIQIIPF